jgi:hypothetical protein
MMTLPMSRSADVLVGMDGNIHRQLAGPSAKIDRRRSPVHSLRLGERTNPTVQNQRMASCEAGSGIYRRLGPVLILRA